MLVKKLIPLLLIAPLLAVAGCGSPWAGIGTQRTAMEQMLLSVAADRALSLGDLPIDGKKVFLDTAYLNTYDKEYVISSFRSAVSGRANITTNAETAEIIVEPRCGTLAIDKSELLFGIPAMPIPLGGIGETPVRTPEIAFFKFGSYLSRAKFNTFAYARDTRKYLGGTGTQYAEAHFTVWIFFFIPFTSSDFLSDYQKIKRKPTIP
ncbi:MAG: hypothetical protein NTX50_00685 [Candidatus Sumerlaeota bacterium]|nr:hypothetical protein [Candidatus Sumerlaeota bacterium]